MGNERSLGASGKFMRIDPENWDRIAALRSKAKVASSPSGEVDLTHYNEHSYPRRAGAIIGKAGFKWSVIVAHSGDCFHDYIPVTVEGNRVTPYRDLAFCGYGTGAPSSYSVYGDDFLRLQLGESVTIEEFAGDYPDFETALKADADEYERRYAAWLASLPTHYRD